MDMRKSSYRKSSCVIFSFDDITSALIPQKVTCLTDHNIWFTIEQVAFSLKNLLNLQHDRMPLGGHTSQTGEFGMRTEVSLKVQIKLPSHETYIGCPAKSELKYD